VDSPNTSRKPCRSSAVVSSRPRVNSIGSWRVLIVRQASAAPCATAADAIAWVGAAAEGAGFMTEGSPSSWRLAARAARCIGISADA